MYGNGNNGYSYGGGYNQPPQQQPAYYSKPYQNYGVNSNERPPVVSQGGCCCSIMWLWKENFIKY